MEAKLLTREQFREGVIARADGRCVFCGAPKVYAHHILERRLWSDGGYYLENGAAVCNDHHLACERTTISVEDVRLAAGITQIVVPEQFYPDHLYDKWGNPLLEDGRRGWGELFFDESVQKVLGEGGVLPLFVPYVKYGRTFHLPWSPGVHDDDRVNHDLSAFEGERIIVTLKRDGENTSMYTDKIHARSLDSRGGEDRAWVKALWARIAHDLPANWRVVGENLWAKHSIAYDDLTSYFEGISIWNERNRCLGADETREYFDLLGITPVPVLYDGPWNVKAIRAVEKDLDWTKDEGYVVRVAREFDYRDFRRVVAKFVRKGHVQTTKHWRAGGNFVPNKLADGARPFG